MLTQLFYTEAGRHNMLQLLGNQKNKKPQQVKTKASVIQIEKTGPLNLWGYLHTAYVVIPRNVFDFSAVFSGSIFYSH